MRLEYKIKKVALTTAIDFSEKRMLKSPERYARNLVEFAQSTYPNVLSNKEATILIAQLIPLCYEKDAQKIRELIYRTLQVE